MVARKKIPEIEPIGDTISPESALIQASNILDVAAMMAAEARDVEGLATVAALYMEMGIKLITDGPGSDDDEEEKPNKGPLGFVAEEPPVIIPVDEGEEKDG